MRRVAAFLAWVGAVVGCAPGSQERVRDYSADGMELYKRGDYVHARDSFQAALALQPGDANLLYNMGQCSERAGEFVKAEQFYQKCLHNSPDHQECRFALAALMVRENRQAEATRMANEWLTRQPGLAAPYALDGWMYRQAGDLPRAQARLQHALQLEPGNALALTELGQVYEAMNRPDRAYVLYENALDVRPDQPEIRNRLASLKRQGINRPHPD